jgi:hypothetical protein
MNRDRIGSRRLFEANEEPSLDEVLTDPVIHLLMRCDGVQMEILQLLIVETQGRLR